MPRALNPILKLSGARCLCASCYQNFNSASAFDLHRVGTYTPMRRRCLSIAEMYSAGMLMNAAGFWITRKRHFLAGTARLGAAISPTPYLSAG